MMQKQFSWSDHVFPSSNSSSIHPFIQRFIHLCVRWPILIQSNTSDMLMSLTINFTFLPLTLDLCPSLSDNTASVLTKRAGFRRREQSLYWLPVLIVDSGSPALSSTNTLSVRVCQCDADGVPEACGSVAFSLPAGLSTGALLAVLACIITLLGKTARAQQCTSWSPKILYIYCDVCMLLLSALLSSPVL